MDAQAIQQRVMKRLGEFPTDRQLQQGFSTLITEASALRTLLSLDAPAQLEDEAVVGHVGQLLVSVVEAACVLGVDLEKALEWGERAAEARLASEAIGPPAVLVSRLVR